MEKVQYETSDGTIEVTVDEAVYATALGILEGQATYAEALFNGFEWLKAKFAGKVEAVTA